MAQDVVMDVGEMERFEPKLTCVCGSCDFTLVFGYDRPAPGDKVFFDIEQGYRREIYSCDYCQHHVAHSYFDMSVLYDGQYVATTYGDNLKATFEKIINLPPERSDNVARVENIIAFTDRYFDPEQKLSVMDVGSGLCVFLHQLRRGRPDWIFAAVDPDPVQSAHARDVVGIPCIQSDFMTLEGQDHAFDIITFNKVLEHVPDPVGMLSKSKAYLRDGGVVYIELPDATQAAKAGPDRQEFYQEHLCTFSMASIVVLAEKAGFTVIEVERLQEPSQKYTLRAFLKIG